MYKLLFLFVLTSVFGSCKPKVLPTVVMITPDEVIVKFSHMSALEDFAQVAMQCAEYNINFQYAGTEFFEDRKLRKLAIQVTTPGGQSGQTTADLSKLQFAYYGFRYSPNGYFKIGAVE